MLSQIEMEELIKMLLGNGMSNIYGMSNGSNDGISSARPTIEGSTYLKLMSLPQKSYKDSGSYKSNYLSAFEGVFEPAYSGKSDKFSGLPSFYNQKKNPGSYQMPTKAYSGAKMGTSYSGGKTGSSYSGGKK